MDKFIPTNGRTRLDAHFKLMLERVGLAQSPRLILEDGKLHYASEEDAIAVKAIIAAFPKETQIPIEIIDRDGERAGRVFEANSTLTVSCDEEGHWSIG